MATALCCEACGRFAKMVDCDGWLLLGRIDIDPSAGPFGGGGMMAMVGPVEMDPQTGLPVLPPPPPPQLTDDPMRAAHVEVCSTACALQYLERRAIWEAAVAPEEGE